MLLLLLLVPCLTVVSFWALSVLLLAVELLPEDCCLVVLAGSALRVDCEPEEDFGLTVSDDLLFVTVLWPAVELVLALLFTVPLDRLVAALFVPAASLVGPACDADLLLLVVPVDMVDALSVWTLA